MKVFAAAVSFVILAGAAVAQDKQEQDWRSRVLIVTDSANSIVGSASAIDGHSILLTPNERYDDREPLIVRLWGVQVPDARMWPWGPWSRSRLDLLLRDVDSVECEVKFRRPNEIMARCFALVRDKPTDRPVGVDIAGALVVAGLAVEDRATSRGTYSAYERKAQEGKKGIWKDLPFATERR